MISNSGPAASMILQRENAFDEMTQIGLENIFYTKDEYCTRRALAALFPKRKTDTESEENSHSFF